MGCERGNTEAAIRITGPPGNPRPPCVRLRYFHLMVHPTGFVSAVAGVVPVSTASIASRK